MRIVVLHLLCLWSSLVCFSFEMEQPHRQKRQLDWNGGGKLFNYDHLALSSNSRPEHRSLPSSLEEDFSSSADEDPVYVAGLSKSGLPGDPGIDYPILPSIPLTDFHCRGRTPGFYGDTQTACQVFHVCDISGRQDSFLCPNGTIFSQKLFACDWWYNVQCAATREHYQLNRNLFKGGDVNVYGTPSFWNWLSESEEEEVNPITAAPPTAAPKLRHQQTAGAGRNKYIARPSPSSPVGPPFQLEQVTEPAPQLSQIEQLPEPAPLVQSGPTQQFVEPVIDSIEVGPISPPQLEPLGPPHWESFLPEIQQAPVVVEPAQPPMPIAEDPDAAMMSQGFTSEYRNHYFSWVNDAIHPGPHMAPELSWADLGPNGPLMTKPSSQLADEQQPTWQEPTWQQPAPVDRRRKAKPAAAQHTQNPIAVRRQTSSSRPATILVPAPQPPVFHPKPAPVKKQITIPPKHVTQAPPKSPKPKLASSDSKTIPSLTVVPTIAPLPALKSKSNKTKPKQLRSSTVTTNAPLADQRYYSINDDDDVTNYDDNSDNKPTNQKIRDVIARQTSRFGSRIKKAKKALKPLPVTLQQPPTAHHQTEARQTQFVPSPKVMPIVPSPLVSISRADSTAANSLNWIPKLNQPATPYRTEPFWTQPAPAQSRAITTSSPVSKPIASRPVVPSVRNAQRNSSKTRNYPAEVRTFEEFVQSSPTTSAPPAAGRKTRISSSFRPSMPIPAITTNSHQPRVRALRAHPSSSTRARSGGKRKRKSKAVYDPRLDRAYEPSHPIWKLQNWESTKI